MTSDINDLKLKRLKISNKILKLEKWSLKARVSQLEKLNAEINESMKSANQNPYIKVLEDEIGVLKATIRKYADHSGISSIIINGNVGEKYTCNDQNNEQKPERY